MDSIAVETRRSETELADRRLDSHDPSSVVPLFLRYLNVIPDMHFIIATVIPSTLLPVFGKRSFSAFKMLHASETF